MSYNKNILNKKVNENKKRTFCCETELFFIEIIIIIFYLNNNYYSYHYEKLKSNIRIITFLSMFIILYHNIHKFSKTHLRYIYSIDIELKTKFS